MSNKMALEEVEKLATQLSPQEQLKLLSRLSERLTEFIPATATVNKKERMLKAAEVLRECD